MNRPKISIKYRFVLGILCIIAGLAFMIHSFLEPRANPVIKPSSFESMTDFGSLSYRQIHHKLAEKMVMRFAIEDFEAEKNFILGFLQKGQDLDGREYILVSEESLWTEALAEVFSFKGIVPSEESLESDSFVSPTYVILERDIFKPLHLDHGADSHVGYQVFSFFGVAVSKTGAGDYKCPERKTAFLLQSLSDLDCFQLWMEKLIHRRRKKLDLSQQIGAFDQIHLKKYIYYYSK